MTVCIFNVAKSMLSATCYHSQHTAFDLNYPIMKTLKSGWKFPVVPSSSSCIHGKLKAQNGKRLGNWKPRDEAIFVMMFSHHFKDGGSHWMCLQGSRQPLYFPFSLLHCGISKNIKTFQNENACASSPYVHSRSDSSTPLMSCFVVIVLFYFFTPFLKERYVRPHSVGACR